MKHHFLVVFEGSLNVFYFFRVQLAVQCLIQLELELSEVELLAHVDVPIRIRNHAWDEPVAVFKVLLCVVFWLWHGSQEVRATEVSLHLLVCQVIVTPQLNRREDIWLDLELLIGVWFAILFPLALRNIRNKGLVYHDRCS